MHVRTHTCTLVALLLSLCGCGKNEPASVQPADVAKPRNSEGKDPPAGLATKKGATLQGPNTKFRAVAFSADGKTLASGGYEQTLLWDLATGKQIGDLKGHEGQIAGLAFSPDGGSGTL